MGIANFSDVSKLIPPDGSLLRELPPELLSKFADLILILKAASILFIIYIIFLIIGGVMRIIERRRIKKIYQKVNEIDEKLDIIIKDKDKKENDNKIDKESEVKVVKKKIKK